MMDPVDEAARRTAINLMRLNEALEHKEAETYSRIPRGYLGDKSPWLHRTHELDRFYQEWFSNVAGGSGMGHRPTKGDDESDSGTRPSGGNK